MNERHDDDVMLITQDIDARDIEISAYNDTSKEYHKDDSQKSDSDEQRDRYFELETYKSSSHGLKRR